MPRLVTIVACLASSLSFSVRAADWPAFRGPTGMGVAAEKGEFPSEWGPDKNVKWKAAIPGGGNGSPIVSGGRVFLAAASPDGARRSLCCYDRTTGKLLWRRDVEYQPDEPTHRTNKYAGSTPAADGERVVVWHGSPGLFCYDFSGTELWSTDPGDVGHVWGYGSSPVIYRGRVILNFGPGDEQFVAAFDLAGGKLQWKTAEPEGRSSIRKGMVGSWSTPVIAAVDGEVQVINSMPSRVVAYDIDDGEILWSVEGLESPRGKLAYTSLMVSGEVGVALGGFHGPGLAFKLGGSGDVTGKSRLWLTEDRQPQRIGSGVIVGDYFYIGNAGPGTIQCIEVQTGKVRWTQRAGGAHWASIVFAGGLLYATNQSATTHVFRPNPDEYEEVAENTLPGDTNATPAFSDGEIFIRAGQSLYCVAAD